MEFHFYQQMPRVTELVPGLYWEVLLTFLARFACPLLPSPDQLPEESSSSFLWASHTDVALTFQCPLP